MATIQIADNDARVQYSQAVTANTTQLTIDFPFFSLDDINLIVTSAAGADTTLSRGTGTGTFAVVGTSVDDGFSGGHVTLGDTYSDAATKYTIFRNIPVTRTTDFPTSGPFNISSLNTELDRIFAIEQELETSIGRTLTLPESDGIVSTTLPNIDTRKGKTLAFNASSGAVEAGPTIAGVTTVSAMAADIAALADIEDGTTATDAISGLAAIKANVTTAAGIASNITTVAGISSNVTSVAGNASNINTVAGNNTNINTVAGISSDVTTVAGISGDVAAVENIAANVTTVAGINSNVTTVAGVSADVTTIAGISSDVTTLANALSATTTYAVTVANVGGSNVFVLDGSNNPAIQLDRGNTYIFDQSDASNSGHTLAFKNGSSSYTTGVTTTGTAGQAGAKTTIIVDAGAPSSGLLYYCVAHGNAMGNSITTVTSNFAVVASNIGNINTVAGNNTNINNVAGISSEISAVNSNSTNINAVNSNSSNINTVAGSNSNITSVAGSIANVNTVASNLTNVNSFADTYFVSGTAPSSPTTGDLWFDTSSDTMKVYGGSGFQNAGSSVNGTSQRFSYTATANQTSFAATYDAGFVDVYLNGIKLINGTDFTATNGTSVVLASGAAVNDTVDIVAFGTFVISNFSVGDANDVTVSGASSGDVLTYNGSAFAPAAPTVPTLASLSIANHNQVTVTGGGAVTATSFAGDGSALTGIDAFASGTKMLFGQTAAPTGWTKITTDDDAALRIVSGTVGTGGSVALSTALATPAVTGTISGSTGSHTLSTAEMPSHNHGRYQTGSGGSIVPGSPNVYNNAGYAYSTSTGGGGSHSHSLSATFSSGTATINAKYVDVIMASKD